MNIKTLLNTYEEALPKVREYPCAICRIRQSDELLIVVTEDELEGAPKGGSRAIIIGICYDCNSEPAKAELTLHKLMSLVELPLEKGTVQ